MGDKLGQIIGVIVIALLVGVLVLVGVHLATDFQLGGNEAFGTGVPIIRV